MAQKMTCRVAGLVGVWLLVMTIANPAMAVLQVDDFEVGEVGGFDNPVFVHNIGPDELYQYAPVFNGFYVGSPISPNHALFLSPGTDYITFNLNAGEFVDYASVWALRVVPYDEGVTMLHAIGVDSTGRPLEYTVAAPAPTGSAEWVFLDTTGAGFAEITEVRLTGLSKSHFDDLAINVVPEPATLGMLALGAGALAWMKRRRLQR